MQEEYKKPQLAILIPTFNRADCLDLNLTALKNQITSQMYSNVEVIVANNGSTDHTADVLKKYNDLPYLKVLTNESNIGAENNFLKLIENSVSEYVWLFGDDEAHIQGSIVKVLSLLNKYPDVGLIHITPVGHFTLAEFNYEMKNPSPSLEVFYDKNKFLTKVSYNISFISSHIFNRRYLLSDIIPAPFVGTYLVQELFFLQAALFAPYNIFVNDYYFSQLLNNTGGYNIFQIFGTNQNRIFNFFKKHDLSKSTIRSINSKILRSFFPTYILQSFNAGKRDSRVILQSPFSILFKNFKFYSNFWIFCFPLLILPPIIGRLLFKILKNIRYISRGARVYRIRNKIR